ncbi:MAG: hypothetical protein LBC45_01970 [Chlamydiales bacterium]|nr:hypothetical protein [Chlamydiales bacterium]
MSLVKKSKICLEDYNYKQDIENRLLISQLSARDVKLLQEILYSPLKIPFQDLSKALNWEEKECISSVKKFIKSELLSLNGSVITVDKEKRKYFTARIIAFDPDFKPGMEFLQGLLKKVPIHILPVWYNISRTSDHIFDSIIERYLLTPQMFQRHLSNLQFPDPIMEEILKDLLEAPEYLLYASDFMIKYSLSSEQFQTIALLLEFHFICCLTYKKIDSKWVEVITFFQEWKDYLLFLRKTKPPTLCASSVKRESTRDFCFLEDMTFLVSLAKKQPFFYKDTLDLAHCLHLNPTNKNHIKYIERLLEKIELLNLASVKDQKISLLDQANKWFGLTNPQKSLLLYRHSYTPEMIGSFNERALREIEKSVLRIVDSEWVLFEDFLKGMTTALSEESSIILKKQGRNWKYMLPFYHSRELILIEAIILEWLFELGIVELGSYQNDRCFRVTEYGRDFLG